ncbi:hypothetical protein OG539_43535 [Actinacidiphila glaucinigra]|uniref:hypothetical protein n=1 Tax=Actinacidiphila glaucinigra TaxID=235986 RepID=UPI00324598D6
MITPVTSMLQYGPSAISILINLGVPSEAVTAVLILHALAVVLTGASLPRLAPSGPSQSWSDARAAPDPSQ